MAQIRYWIWLSSLEGLRPISMKRLVEHFHDPMEAYYAPVGGFDAVPELTARERAVLDRRDLGRAEEILELLAREQYPEIRELLQKNVSDHLDMIEGSPSGKA